MDKRGALFFKLLTGVFALILAGYLLPRAFSGEPAYELQGAQICEVGDGSTVSGFVVRYERLLYSGQAVSFPLEEGQWIGAKQPVAVSSEGSVDASEAGYVSYALDGYETVLTPELVHHAEGQELLTLEPDKLPPEAIGKLILSQNWYFAVPNGYPELSVGQKLSLKLRDQICEAQVLRTQGLLLLECSSGLHALTDLRYTEAQLYTHTFPAIQLSKEAVYYIDGESCVYILSGARVRRKNVRILRIEEDRILIHPEDLPLGAQVILTEKEITDGMVLE